MKRIIVKSSLVIFSLMTLTTIGVNADETSKETSFTNETNTEIEVGNVEETENIEHFDDEKENNTITEDNLVNITLDNTVFLKEAEIMLLNYLTTNGFNYDPFSIEFNDYIAQQILFDNDLNLTSHPNYNNIYVYMSEYYSALQLHLVEDSEESFNLNNDLLNKTTFEIINNTIQENEESDFISGISSRTVSFGNLSLSKGKAYAKKYVNSRNTSKYNNFPSNCTNYVSQILFAAGAKEKAPKNWQQQKFINANKSYWYGRSTGKSHKTTSTFVNVVDFYNYWGGNRKEFSNKNWKNSISYAKEGDVIQYKNKAGKWFHAGFVYRKDKNNLYVAMNSSNYLERKLSDSIKTCSAVRIIKTGMK